MSNQKQAKKDNLEALRHTTEHVMHQAVKELFPQIHLAMGPATADGFYNDFDSSPEGKKAVKVSEEDFPKIEKRMQEIIDLDLPLIRKEVSEKEARDLFKGNPYKQEWIDGIVKKGQPIIVYWTGKPGERNSMADLCSGPHLKSTGEIKAFKLLSVAGAYWHGDEKNKMLTRIYGTAFFNQKDLDQHLKNLEEAKKRDHRALGKELDLFIIDEAVGQGLPLWMPKGAILYNELKDFAFKTYLKRGYDPVISPHIGNLNLWKTSGHLDFYRDSMYQPFGIEKEKYCLKPMNCPFHVQIYNARKRSYKELPFRWAEMGTVYRYEKSGELSGLVRVRGFTQDDAHIICLPEQLNDELIGMLDLTKYIWETLGLKDFKYSLSVSDPKTPKKYLGNRKSWERAEKALEKVLKEKNLPYQRYPGEAAFYGPKIDVIAKDSLDREWQLSTIQIDFNLPSRFKMTYVDKDGKEKEPIMLHRALLGSLERTLGILIEHYGGAFPVWLSPVQAMIIPIAERHQKYAQSVEKKLKDHDVRVEVDLRDDTMQAKIRDAQLQKIPYMLVVGNKEEKKGGVAVRLRSGKDLGLKPLDEFVKEILKKIENRDLEI